MWELSVFGDSGEAGSEGAGRGRPGGCAAASRATPRAALRARTNLCHGASGLETSRQLYLRALSQVEHLYILIIMNMGTLGPITQLREP